MNDTQVKTGADAERQMASMRSHLIRRYRLTTVPGRPEELVKAGTDQGVSLGYGCKTIRVRPMIDRSWQENRHDYQLGPDWSNDMNRQLDRHFGFISPTTIKIPDGHR